MTAQRKLKHHVRSRMAKTGESYTTALRFIRKRESHNGDSGSKMMTTTLNNRFVLEQELASTPTGTVYRALDLRAQEGGISKPYVAVKTLERSAVDSAKIRQLQHHAHQSRLLRSDHVLTVFDIDRDGDTLFMTMEYAIGATLDTLMPIGKPFAAAARALTGVADAVSKAHAKQLVHGNLSPARIYWTDENIAKVFDFALSAETTPAADPADRYASLSRLSGNAASPADDVYSFAVLASQLHSGQHPFRGLTANVAARQHLVPDNLEAFSSATRALLIEAMSFDTARDRPTINDLAAVFNG